MMAAGILDLTHWVGVEASGAAPMLPVRRAPVTGSTMTMVTGSLVTWRPSASQEEEEEEGVCLLPIRHFMFMVDMGMVEVEVGEKINHTIQS